MNHSRLDIGKMAAEIPAIKTVKSGHHLVLIAKRLYNSEAIKEIYPDDNERLHHILKNQIFGVAPSKITESARESPWF